MSKRKRILITPGEPAGVGPDITLLAAQKHWDAELIAVADPNLLLERAKLLGLPIHLSEVNFHSSPNIHLPGHLQIVPVSLSVPARPAILDSSNAAYVLETLKIAANLCLQGQAHAIVTGPVHKGIINQAGVSFSGHTEFFAEQAHVTHTVMFFIVDQLKVALLTTHLPLAKVSSTINKDLLQHTITLLHQSLQHAFDIIKPRILVCGLNPHAGEGGYLGREEIDIIDPALAELRQQGYDLEGPLPADTLFTPHVLTRGDAVLAMYHDQALPLVKYLGFGHAVNMTLGLPFIRTSVDHGTALDKAGTMAVDSGSLSAALSLAIQLK